MQGPTTSIMVNQAPHQASFIIVAQALLTLAIGVVTWAIWGWTAGYSAWLGGVVVTVASGLTAWWLFGRYRAQDLQGLAMRVYTAQALKLMIVAAAFYACFRWVQPLNPAALFLSFLLVQVVPSVLTSTASGGAKAG